MKNIQGKNSPQTERAKPSLFEKSAQRCGLSPKMALRRDPVLHALLIIEPSLNSLKAHVKRALSQHGPSIPSVGTTFVSARRQLLLNVYPGAIQSITQVATLNAFYHVFTVYSQRGRMDCNPIPNAVHNPSHPEIELHIQAISIIFQIIKSIKYPYIHISIKYPYIHKISIYP